MSTPDPASRRRPRPDPIVRSGGPAADRTSFTVAHRAMLADLRRLAETAARLAAVPAALGREQAVALRDYLQQLCDEIHQHHSREDEVLRPLIVASASDVVDLTPFSYDHTALSPIVDRVHAAARALPTDPARVIGELADGLAGLRDLMHEHISAEERDVFPIIDRYVSNSGRSGHERRTENDSDGGAGCRAPTSRRGNLGDRRRRRGAVHRLLARPSTPAATSPTRWDPSA